MKINLRDNQIEPVRKGIFFFNRKDSVPSIIVAPTAFGKSIVIAKIVEGVNDKILIIQPSKELLEQNYNKYINNGGKAAIYSASFNSKQIGNVTYATIGSIKKMAHLFKKLEIKKIIVDEVDRFPRSVEGMFRSFIEDSGITHVLGLTATPFKLQTNSYMRKSYSIVKMLTSKSKSGNYFKEIIHVSQIQEMTKLGFWSTTIYDVQDVDTSLLKYNSNLSDFTEDSINIMYDYISIENMIVDKIKKHNDRKSILIFVPSIEKAEKLKSLIKGSEVVHSLLNKKDRDFVVNGFKNLSIRVVINVSVLSVGFDHPELDCIIMARPTASLSWYYQAIGRITRIHENKKNGLIIDFSNNVKRFGRVEDFYFKKEKKSWKMFGGNGKLLTGIPIHEIGEHYDVNCDTSEKIIMPYGKHRGKEVRNIPQSYRNWMLKEFEWNSKNMHIKKEIERLNN